MNKIDKEVAIKSMLSDLKKGIGKATILQTIARKYSNSQKTFYNYFDVAEKKYKDFLEKANPIIEAKEIEAMAKVAESGILSKIARQLLLSDIATGKVKVWKQGIGKHGIETLEIYDPQKYIAELNKMDGAYILPLSDPLENKKPFVFEIITKE